MCPVSLTLLNFISDPSFYWKSNERQTKKTLERVSAKNHYFGWTDREMVSYCTYIAYERLRKARKTIFISSFGASGSHLLQQIISNAIHAVPLGEVYIAPGLIEIIMNMSEIDKNIFIEAYHLLHSKNPDDVFKSGPIINTAHKPTLEYFKDWVHKYEAILLLRDPVELTMSRTFRKDEYRDYLYPKGISDKDYLDENIKKVKVFYNSALSFSYDFSINFEDMVDNNKEFQESLAKVCVSEEYRTENLEKMVTDTLLCGEDTNKYSGFAHEAANVEWLEYVKSGLTDITGRMGYASS